MTRQLQNAVKHLIDNDAVYTEQDKKLIADNGIGITYRANSVLIYGNGELIGVYQRTDNTEVLVWI